MNLFYKESKSEKNINFFFVCVWGGGEEGGRGGARVSDFLQRI